MDVSGFIPLVAMLIPVVAIIGGICVGIAGILSGAKVREARIRERIAMIEKGLVPPPEVDPAGFDRAMHRHERSSGPGLRRAGILVMGVGLGLMFLISVAGGTVREGIGVGGFLIIVGLAFLINSMLEPQRNLHTQGPAGPPGPPMPPTA
jgi:phosphotransferase system  glucose/maltose/N-acetylglucosamine-specific IIC component